MVGEARLVLDDLFRHVGVEGSVGAGRPLGQHGHRCRVDGAHGVNGCTDPLCVGRLQQVDPLDPRVGGPIAESTLRTGRCGVAVGVESAVEVEGVEQRDPDAGSSAAASSACPISLGSAYGVPSG